MAQDPYRCPDAAIAELVSRPRVVEILDALTQSPMTRRALARHVHAGGRTVCTGLRALAAHAAVQRGSLGGSWDCAGPATARYELTGHGRRLVDRLSRLEEWTALYEHYLR